MNTSTTLVERESIRLVNENTLLKYTSSNGIVLKIKDSYLFRRLKITELEDHFPSR